MVKYKNNLHIDYSSYRFIDNKYVYAIGAALNIVPLAHFRIVWRIDDED